MGFDDIIISPCRKIILSNTVHIPIEWKWLMLFIIPIEIFDLHILFYLCLFLNHFKWCSVKEHNYFYKEETISNLIFCDMPSYL